MFAFGYKVIIAGGTKPENAGRTGFMPKARMRVRILTCSDFCSLIHVCDSGPIQERRLPANSRMMQPYEQCSIGHVIATNQARMIHIVQCADRAMKHQWWTECEGKSQQTHAVPRQEGGAGEQFIRLRPRESKFGGEYLHSIQ